MHIPTVPTGWFPRVATASAEDVAKVTSPGTQMLLAMAATGRPVYPGTVAPAVVAKRHARNKAARIARRAGRR